MTSLFVSIFTTSPCVTALALGCAHTQARECTWVADFGTDPKSAVEEVELLVLALTHGAQGALARGRVLGNAPDLFIDDPAQDKGPGIETTGHEGARMGKSSIKIADLEGTGIKGADLGGTRRDVQSAP